MSDECTTQKVGDMKFKQLAAGATVAGALCAAALGIGTGIANADPGHPGGPGGGNGGPPAPGGNPPGDHGAPPPGGGNNFHGAGGPGGPAPQGHGGPGGPGGGPQDHGPGGPGGGPQDHDPGGPGGPGGPWHGDGQRGYFHGAPWGEGAAPWGYGAPPRPVWGGPIPGPGGPWVGGPINYYGYNETPYWNPGFNQFGFDFFGVWIPL
jgi:hypothetical protein